MADKKTRAELSKRFATYKIPTEDDFQDLFASAFNQLDDGIRKHADEPLEIKLPATGGPGAPKEVLRLYEDFDADPLWKMQVRNGKLEISRGSLTSPDLFIEYNGNVHIGTPTDPNILNISGQAYVTDSLHVGGGIEPAVLSVSGKVVFYSENGGPESGPNGLGGKGQRLVFNQMVDANAVPPGIGLSNAQLWHTVNKGTHYAWYVGTETLMQVSQHDGLTVNGKTQTSGLHIAGGNLGQLLKIEANGAPNFEVMANGNVGIGMSYPSHDLQVMTSFGNIEPVLDQTTSDVPTGRFAGDVNNWQSFTTGDGIGDNSYLVKIEFHIHELWFNWTEGNITVYEGEGVGINNVLHRQRYRISGSPPCWQEVVLNKPVKISPGAKYTVSFDPCKWSIGSTPYPGVSSVPGNLPLMLKTYYVDSTSRKTTLAVSLNRVGVGTEFPDAKLTVLDDQKASLSIQTPDNTRSNGIAFQNSGGHYTWNIFRENADGNNANLVIAGGEAQENIDSLRQVMRFSSNGNVGIGTNNPTEKLEVNGNVKAAEFHGKFFKEDGTELAGGGSPSPWTVSGGNITLPAGHVGIGTNEPKTNLHIFGNDSASELRILSGGDDKLSSIVLGRTEPKCVIGLAGRNMDIFSSANPGDLCIRQDDLTKRICLGVGNEGVGELMIINNKVGIGTATPQSTLDVAGNAKVHGMLIVSNGILMMSNADRGIYIDPRDNQTYKVVRLSDGKYWMAENLRFETNSGSWVFPQDQYPDGVAYEPHKYGRLYTWDAARAACPPGWRLPSDEEWRTMANLYGGNVDAGSELARSKLIFGGESTFNALHGGYRNTEDKYWWVLGSAGNYWSGTQVDARNARSYNFSDKLYRQVSDKSLGFSSRCILD